MSEQTIQKRAPLLVELGTEELPPSALKTLAIAFHDHLLNTLGEAGLLHETHSRWFATPRRLSVLIEDVATKGAAQNVEKRGPALAAAYDDNGQPTKAVLGFARSCGVDIDALDTLETDKGKWLIHRSVTPGVAAKDLIGSCIQAAIEKLPIPKRMRWGNHDSEFVRPVHWLVVLLGRQIMPCNVLGIVAGRKSRGHRFMGPNAEIAIAQAQDYEETLGAEGAVVVDFDARKKSIEQQVNRLAKKTGGRAIMTPALLDTVTALVEKPFALLGTFDPGYLKIPAEALISSMRDHQKYFHVVDDNDALLPFFITVSNIRSSSPARVRSGNERVLNARLADARFFWETDSLQPLESRVDQLKHVLFHHALGSLADKTRRLESIAVGIAAVLDANPVACQRAATLCKADLVSGMVGEFPEMQGTMGKYLARHDQEPATVSAAIEEHYLPRYAGDALPESAVGRVLALADRIDSLLGLFIAAEEPSGEKDPYGLRRAALGIIRILVDKKLDIDISTLVTITSDAYAAGGCPATPEVVNRCQSFIADRYRALYHSMGFAADEISAVIAVGASHPLDFDKRLRAVATFRSHPDAAGLAAANKRIRNILRKNKSNENQTVDVDLLSDPAEIALFSALTETATAIQPDIEKGDFQAALRSLAGLRATVDQFFNDVMVLADDSVIRANRLALVNNMHQLFLGIADISLLQDQESTHD